MDIKEILGQMEKKPMSLFYGAGVSMDCGGPSGVQLLNSVKTQYPGGSSENFFEYMNKTIDFDNSNRNEIETWIRNHLSSISPNDEHRYLFSLPWRAILTTNYDRLPNLVLKTIDGRRVIAPVVNSNSDYPIDQGRPSILYCFKLIGDVDYSFPNGGWMVLSSNDLKLAFGRRRMFFQMFNSLASSGHIIYIGYSFRDNLVFDLLQEMTYVLRSLPWKGFAITKSEPSSDALGKMKTLGITWVKGSLKEFVDAAKSVFGETPVSAPSVVNQFYVHNFPMRLERATVDNIWRKFEIFDVTMLEAFSKEPKYFFEGVDRSFYPFVAKWDFPRKTKLVWINKENPQTKAFDFKDFVNKRSRDGNSSHNIIVSLIGSAGSGKTTVAKRIAFDWYRSGNPVVFIDPENLTIDKLALDGLLDEIWKNYQEATSETRGEKPSPVRFLLVADDCGSLLEQLMDLNSHLKSIGKPADILLVTRGSDVPLQELINVRVDVVLEIDDTVVQEEWAEFMEHFNNLGVIDREILVSNLMNPSINSSFFALIYTSVHEVRKTLKELILEEFQSLDSDSQRIYAMVTLFQSQMLKPLVSLTLRSSRIQPDWLESQIRKGRLGGVLRFERGQTEIVAANRVVADIICESVFRTIDQFYLALRNIISAVTLGDRLEMRLLHLLLIERLGSRLGRQLKSEQKIELFRKGVEMVRSKPLLLHLAILQMYSGKFDEAKETLKEALEAHIPGFDEPDQHVIDAKGRLELRLAENAMQKKEDVAAWGHLENAENYFHGAQINPNLTPHPYQGLGKTYLSKARIATDAQSKWLYILLAMQECSYAENYLGGEINPGITSLKKETITLLATEKLDEVKIQQIDSQIGRGNAYAFLAECEIQKGDYEKALYLVGKGSAEDSSNLWLMRLHVAILKRTAPYDAESIRKVLDDYVKIADKRFDVPLSFELAMDTFQSGDFGTAVKLFRELDQRTKNHSMRLTPSPQNRWLENGKPKEFFGVIVEAPRYGKYGRIECTSLPGYRSTLPVRVQDVEFHGRGGERVAFSIIFNMVGPQASRVRKIAF